MIMKKKQTKETLIKKEVGDFEVRISREFATVTTKSKMYRFAFGQGTVGMAMLVNWVSENKDVEGSETWLINLSNIAMSSLSLLTVDNNFPKYVMEYLSNIPVPKEETPEETEAIINELKAESTIE